MPDFAGEACAQQGCGTEADIRAATTYSAETVDGQDDQGSASATEQRRDLGSGHVGQFSHYLDVTVYFAGSDDARRVGGVGT